MREYNFMVPDNGKLTDGARQIMANVIATFAGKHIRITVAEKKEKRSLDQNAYYRGVVLPHVRRVMFECGDARSLDDWHEVLLLSFSPLVNVTALNGDSVLLPERTHKMSVEDMAKFITLVSAEMAMRGEPVPVNY